MNEVPLKWICCEARMRYDELKSLNRAVLRTTGTHQHACPPVNIPDKCAYASFKDVVLSDSKTKPLSLVTGSESKAPIRRISPAFNNLDRVAYYRKKALQEIGVKVEEGDGIRSLSAMDDRFDGVIVGSSIKKDCAFVSVQSSFMNARLMDEEGRLIGGVVTDTTYSYFRDGYLLSSAVYSLQLRRWVPVLYSWIRGLDLNHQKQHFLCLLQ